MILFPISSFGTTRTLGNKIETLFMNYNDHNLFIWNNPNLLHHDGDSYRDVFVNTGSIVKGQFENNICALYLNDQLKIIKHSNHFLNHLDFGYFYNQQYKIYDNIVKNYYEILNCKDVKLLDDQVYFYMLNPFNFSNSGHDLSTILSCANYILNNNLKNILIYKDYNKTNNFYLIKLLLPDCNFVELNPNTVYKIPNLIVIFQECYHITTYKYLLDKLVNTIPPNESLKNKNIILIKSNRNQNVMNAHTQYQCEDMIVQLETNGFINIIPEDTSIIDLFSYLYFANKIVFSTGSIIYTNQLFMRQPTKLLFLNPCEKDGDMEGIDGPIKHIKIVNNVFTKEQCLEYANEIINY